MSFYGRTIYGVSKELLIYTELSLSTRPGLDSQQRKMIFYSPQGVERLWGAASYPMGAVGPFLGV
jgi:hypothetical protein